MFVYKYSVCFVIFSTIVLYADLIVAKRGCASFGHSCFGGHGKRSQDGEILPAELDTDLQTNRHITQGQGISDLEQFSSIYDVHAKPKNDVKTILKTLVDLYEESQRRLHKKQVPKYYNY